MKRKIAGLRSQISSSMIAFIFLLSLQAQVISAAGGGQGQQPQPQPPPTAEAPRPSGVLTVTGEDYFIGRGDVLSIQVDKAPELSGTFSVDSKGMILMNYLGLVPAHQRTPRDLAKLIEEGLRGRYLTEPHVTVQVTQFNSRSFFIQGAVRNPGVYQIVGTPSILKLITIAGGLADNHGTTAFVIREIADREGVSEKQQPAGAKTAAASPAEEPDYEMIRVHIGGLFKGVFDQNLTIEPGDIVNIPPADVFFVAGEVNAPGSFPLKEGTSLRQAISLAQGVTFDADKKGTIIFREDLVNAKREEIKVDIGAVMSGKNKDITIMANDVIIIPNSRMRSFGGTLLRAFGIGAMRGPMRRF